MATLAEIAEQSRAALDARHAAREQALALSREVIRTCATAIRAIHRSEFDRARELIAAAGDRIAQLSAGLAGQLDLYGAGYVYDCQKEFAEACLVYALLTDEPLPDPRSLGIDYPAYLNGMGEAVGEMRRHVLDEMRRGNLARAEQLLNQMDEIYFLLVTLDYPDAMTGGLRRTTDAVRGIVEKTRGELTTALRQDELRDAIRAALGRLDASSPR